MTGHIPPGSTVAQGSVVIAASNEAPVIRRCLDSLVAGFSPGELEIAVVCNGCTDDTASVARSCAATVRVVELAHPSKPAALRAGDAIVSAFPRLYLDADVVVPAASARAVLDRLRDGAVAARPPIHYDAISASAPVRSYYRARARVPSVMGSLWGAGFYGLSARGRSRFGEFPDVVADDLWVDRQFAPSEVEIVDCAPVVVAVPRRSDDLVRVLRRTYRGKSGLVPAAGESRSPRTVSSTVRDLGELAGAGPRAAADALTYASFAVAGRLALAAGRAATIGGPGPRWERDDSTRSR